MKASKTNQKITLELSPIEMHIIMQAMDSYAYKQGYGQWGKSTRNDSHAIAAEQVHDELLEIYADESDTSDIVELERADPGKFYSSSITSLQDFEDYLNAKGYSPRNLAEIPNDGYYAEVLTVSQNVKDFTQINLKLAHHNSGQVSPLAPSMHSWVRLSFKDCTNKAIINS